VPGSKSHTARALLLAGLLPGESVLLSPLDCDDTRTLAAALERLGARVVTGPAAWSVTGPLAPGPGEVVIDIGAAGTPARLLLAVLCALPGRFVLDGSPRMRERPMWPLVDSLRAQGARIESLGRDGHLPLRVHGETLRGGKVEVRGDVSSQFVSALLLASPLVPGGLDVRVTGPLSSAAYVGLTRGVLAAFTERGKLRAVRYEVPGDDSAACFPVAGALVSGGNVRLLGLERESAQADAVFRSWATEAGGTLAWQEGALVVQAPRFGLKPIVVDVDAAPDAALPLAAVLGFARGRSRFSGVARLREKESDRLAAARDLLTRAGIPSTLDSDGEGRPFLSVDGAAAVPRAAAFAAHGDHRVAMTAAVLALALPPGSTLDDPGCVAKSWPGFWEEWARLTDS
jgi:3-phosphoshikimate 1-carboxyvinyltransferase